MLIVDVLHIYNGISQQHAVLSCLVKQLQLIELNPFKLLDVRRRFILHRKSIIVLVTDETSCSRIVFKI